MSDAAPWTAAVGDPLTDAVDEQVCAWMRRAGLDPDRVTRVEVRDGVATVTEYVDGDDGAYALDVERGVLVTRERTMPVTEPPPEVGLQIEVLVRVGDGEPHRLGTARISGQDGVARVLRQAAAAYEEADHA